MSSTVFVGNLSPDTTEDEITQLFSRCGPVLSCKIPRDPSTGRWKFVAFVQFEDSASANSALKSIHGVELKGRPLRVTTTRPYKTARNAAPPAPIPQRFREGPADDRESRPGRFGPRPPPRLWDDEPPAGSEWSAARAPPRDRPESDGRLARTELRKALVRELVDQAVQRVAVEDTVRMVLDERRSAEGRTRVSRDQLLDLVRSLMIDGSVGNSNGVGGAEGTRGKRGEPLL
jgi:RNA recognition motif-containing protein